MAVLQHDVVLAPALPRPAMARPLARRALIWGFERLPSVVRNSFDPRLQERILRLEAQKSDLNLQELHDCYRHRCHSAPSAWRGLGSIAYEIVKSFRPKVVCELGSFSGFSTFAMGLALRDLAERGQLYAVDTWQGDPHAGFYGEELYENFLSDRRKLRLDDVVVPLRMTFEEASRRIPEGIDLLHIDGWHTFRAVRNDFRAFRPLLNPGAVVLFHDVRGDFFGMRVFWRWLTLRYQSYRIPYSSGLGVIRMPS